MYFNIVDIQKFKLTLFYDYNNKMLTTVYFIKDVEMCLKTGGIILLDQQKLKL